MTLHYNEPDQRHIDFLVELASKNICDGVIEEPRVFFDQIMLNDVGVVSKGSPDVFVNGEQFPVRLTHMSLALIPNFTGNIGTNERLIQRVGVRLAFHDQFYMARDHLAAPLWLNKHVAAADLITRAVSSHVFARPVVLSARDSLRIEVQLETMPASPRRVAVGVTGTGMLSKRPYFFGDEIELSNTTPTILDTSRYRNDGAEPIALTDMTINCGAEQNDVVGQGDIRRLRLNVRQVGNGTNADWYQGPTSPAPLTRCPAVLLGYNTGRAIVHRFPGDGLLWEPGEGITVDMQALDTSVTDVSVGISLWGYISVI